MEILNETIVFLLDLHLIEVKTSNSEGYSYPKIMAAFFIIEQLMTWTGNWLDNLGYMYSVECHRANKRKMKSCQS